MLYNYLSGGKRTVTHCNTNMHMGIRHMDRILQEHDLLYITEGTWKIAQDGIEYELQADDMILLQGRHHHYGTAPCDVVRTYYIVFPVEEGDEVGCRRASADDEYAFPMVVHCQEYPQIKALFKNIIASFWAEEVYEKRKTAAYLELLLCELSGIQENEAGIIREVKQMIQQNPYRFVKNGELAGACGCSVRTLMTKFKEGTGETIHLWQMKLKCQMAQELMRNEPDVTLKEIAAIYGFYDEYHFGKCYKKTMGYSPKRGKE